MRPRQGGRLCLQLQFKFQRRWPKLWAPIGGEAEYQADCSEMPASSSVQKAPHRVSGLYFLMPSFTSSFVDSRLPLVPTRRQHSMCELLERGLRFSAAWHLQSTTPQMLGPNQAACFAVTPPRLPISLCKFCPLHTPSLPTILCGCKQVQASCRSLNQTASLRMSATFLLGFSSGIQSLSLGLLQEH